MLAYKHINAHIHYSNVNYSLRSSKSQFEDFTLVERNRLALTFSILLSLLTTILERNLKTANFKNLFM